MVEILGIIFLKFQGSEFYSLGIRVSGLGLRVMCFENAGVRVQVGPRVYRSGHKGTGQGQVFI
jgi:hypothetical protein